MTKKYSCYLVGIVWPNKSGEESFYDLISDDENVIDMMGQLACCVQGRR